MFPVDSGVTPPTLPEGWTAYTDPASNRTYYVHLPTGDTQWTRPPPPPPPPPPQQLNLNDPPPPPSQPMTHSYQSPNQYYSDPQMPHSVQSQPRYNSNQRNVASIGWSNTRQHFIQTNNHNNIPPPPPNLSHTYDPHWQSKPLRRPPQQCNADFHTYNPPAKRPRVQDTATVATTKKCWKCGIVKNWESFSKRQWLAGDASRKCKPCVNETVAENERSMAPAAEAAKPDPTSQTKERRKVCSSCGEQRAWELFSKSQWTSKDDSRKCKPCIEKLHQAQANNANQSQEPVGKDPKVCSSCGERRGWKSFSKTHWIAKDDVRKCKACAEKDSALQEDGTKSEAPSAKESTNAEELDSNGIVSTVAVKSESEDSVWESRSLHSVKQIDASPDNANHAEENGSRDIASMPDTKPTDGGVKEESASCSDVPVKLEPLDEHLAAVESSVDGNNAEGGESLLLDPTAIKLEPKG